VEANWRGRGKYFPGKITRDHGNGSSTLTTTTASSWRHTQEKEIRLPVAVVLAALLRQGRSHRDGPRAEATECGRGRFYPGKDHAIMVTALRHRLRRRSLVSRRRRRSVCWAVVAVVEAVARLGPLPRALPQVGDKVEGNYRGRGR
jgi:hypothetical protein